MTPLRLAAAAVALTAAGCVSVHVSFPEDGDVRPKAAPTFSSGQATGPVGLDAAYRFALPSSSSVCGEPVPSARARWA